MAEQIADNIFGFTAGTARILLSQLIGRIVQGLGCGRQIGPSFWAAEIQHTALVDTHGTTTFIQRATARTRKTQKQTQTRKVTTWLRKIQFSQQPQSS
jgi:hypothetical protein